MLLLAALLRGGAAVADPTSDKLTRIEEETMLLKARERQLDVRASILNKQTEIASREGAISQQGQAGRQADPVVHGVEGLGRAMFATLEMADGSLVEAQAGDVLANGMRVLSVAPGNVVVLNGKKKQVRLAAYVPRQAVPMAGLPSSGMMPPLPPLPPAPSMSPLAPKGGVR
jgi:type IV pilus biogenesis protein PilP